MDLIFFKLGSFFVLTQKIFFGINCDSYNPLSKKTIFQNHYKKPFETIKILLNWFNATIFMT